MAIPLRDDADVQRTPYVTYALILANLVVFLFLQPVAFQWPSDSVVTRHHQEREAEHFVERWGTISCEVVHLRPLSEGVTCGKERITRRATSGKSVLVSLVTSTFVHGGLLHLLGNMLFLWVFGGAVENRLGHGGYLLFYLAGGVVSGVGYALATPSQTQAAVGASGAIAAVMGAYFVLRPRGRILSAIYTSSIQVVYLPAFVLLGLFFVSQFFLPSDELVAWEAHVSGMVFGAVVMAGVLLVSRRRRRAEPAVTPVGSLSDR